MKLAEKKTLAVQKNQERAKEVAEGLKLAKSVDILRNTYAEEQTKLRLFRESTLKSIKDEMERFLAEKNILIHEVKTLKEERILAQAPIDLVTEWKKVKDDRKSLTTLTEDILDRETKLISKETTVKSKEEEFFEREEKIKELENLANRYVTEREKEYRTAENTRLETDQYKIQTTKILEDEDMRLREKETKLLVRERDLKLQQDQVETDKREIANDRIHIESQQQTLRIAWDNIRKLKN